MLVTFDISRVQSKVHSSDGLVTSPSVCNLQMSTNLQHIFVSLDFISNKNFLSAKYTRET